ncbi:MAG: HAMP domain-containing histidine kinase [Epsilonproteobacteria bacterium]|nr:HAMP domain-containing histidine kinase [Campylobacterota bacterium]
MTSFKSQEKALVSSFMHELKTPLAIVRSHLESEISDASLDTRLRRKLVLDVEALARLNNLINEMNLLLNCEAQCDVKNFQDYSLLEILVDIVELLEPLAESKQQKLSLVADENIIIKMHPEKFQQLLLNLVSNALKYTPEHGKIHLSLRQEKKTIIVEVRDTGIGIELLMQERIFDPFFRLHTKETQGAGLGLAIAQAIAKQHFGEISVQSTLGEGSCFYLRLPKEKVCK